MRITGKHIAFDAAELERLSPSRLIDVRFDGHRVWSKRLPDAVDGRVTVKWPRAIREKLRGRTSVRVEDSVSGVFIAERDARFGFSRQRVAITDKRGQWMAMTKWDRLGPVLEGSNDLVAGRLVASAARLVDDMESLGYPVYIVGGSLLGVTRNGDLLPHDDDIDLAFLSDESSPLDLGLVSYDMERQLTDRGYTIVRHSLAQLEVVFFDALGEIDHYIDIFTGFFHDGLYCQPFALRGPEVTREDLLPTQRLIVNGVPLPAPANPEAWLRYAYGEGWREPDPTFKFVVPSGTKYRFGSWFGIFNRGRYFWEKHYQGRTEPEIPPRGADDVADFLARIPAGSNVLDLGSGDGSLTRLIAAAGHRVVGVDFAYEALRVAEGVDPEGLRFLRVNLNDRAAMLELAADVVRTREVWHVFMRDTIHGLTFVNKENVYLFLAAALRGDAIAFVTFYNTRDINYRRGDPRSWSYKHKDFEASTRQFGLDVIEMRDGGPVKRRPRTLAVLKRGQVMHSEEREIDEERDEDLQ